MKIIRVLGCHDCDKRGIHIRDNGEKALFPKYWCPRLNINIMNSFNNKTPHENCPLEDEVRDGKYNELLFAVGSKFPDESRHETALRYIKEAEKPTMGVIHNESFDFLNDEGEDIYTGTEGEMITFKDKDKV